MLGPNGAGKTTFVNLVATRLRPDDGSLRVHGIDVARHPTGVPSLPSAATPACSSPPVRSRRRGLLKFIRGLIARLRSLPIPRSAVLVGRAVGV